MTDRPYEPLRVDVIGLLPPSAAEPADEARGTPPPRSGETDDGEGGSLEFYRDECLRRGQLLADKHLELERLRAEASSLKSRYDLSLSNSRAWSACMNKFLIGKEWEDHELGDHGALRASFVSWADGYTEDADHRDALQRLAEREAEIERLRTESSLRDSEWADRMASRDRLLDERTAMLGERISEQDASPPSSIYTHTTAEVQWLQSRIKALESQREDQRVSRWHASYNAALAGLLSRDIVANAKGVARWATEHADAAHGELKEEP